MNIPNLLRKQFSAASFFIVLFGLAGWIATLAFTFYFLVLLFTPPQFCGYYIQHNGDYYQVKMYWKYGIDTIAYQTFNGKEAIEILKQLSEQPQPLKIQQQRPKEL